MKHCDGYSLSPWCNGYGQGMRSELAVDRASRHGPFPGRLDAQRISAYAAATGDVTAAVLTGAAVPVVFPVILVFGAQGLIGIEDPGSVRRLAVRFASPTRMGADLTVSALGISDGMFAFEAACAGATVITHGRLELFS
jgi:hypothetical protein